VTNKTYIYIRNELVTFKRMDILGMFTNIQFSGMISKLIYSAAHLINLCQNNDLQ